MITDLDLAVLCWSCYNAPDVFNSVIDTDGVWVGVKHYDDCSAVAFRGSATIEDWFRDFQGIMTDDSDLGGIEQGFSEGIKDIWYSLAADISPLNKLYITGHSLGAARALIFGGYDYYSSKAPIEIVTFGSPRPGGQKLKDILEPIAIRSYKNGDDPVCDVPFDIPVLEPYVHPRDLIDVDVMPRTDDPWGLLARHHSDLYVQAMKDLQNG